MTWPTTETPPTRSLSPKTLISKTEVASGDTTHESALKEMKGRWKNPLSGMGWYRKTKKEFAALPED